MVCKEYNLSFSSVLVFSFDFFLNQLTTTGDLHLVAWKTELGIISESLPVLQ